MEIPKRVSVTSMISVASSLDNSPYIRLMTESSNTKQREQRISTDDQDLVVKNENESTGDQGIILIVPPTSTSSSPKQKSGSYLPLSLAKSRMAASDKGAGSKIFENYTAQIRERSNQNGEWLAVPSMSSDVRRGSLNNISSEDPDFGDSSRFTRRSKVRSTWSAGSITSRKNALASPQPVIDDLHAKKDQKKSHNALRSKIGKLFTGGK